IDYQYLLKSGGLFMSDNQVKIKKQTIDPTLTLEDVKNN
ncbi:RNA polymerase sigma factor RpoD domain protein, partial [Staphylococcus epidermidis 14.1.R1.SE]